MYDKNYETLIGLIPKKEISRFKSILSYYVTLEVEDWRGEYWTYLEGWDIVSKTKYPFCGIASQFKDNLSNSMFVYDNLVVFVEHKGIHAEVCPKVTLLDLDKGCVKFKS